MRALTRAFLVAALFPGLAAPSAAQTAVDPSGHWEGTVSVPDNPVTIEMDITKNAKGELAGTFGQPAQNVRGLPLSSVSVEGRTLRVVLKAGGEPSTFSATISEDGKSMTGDVTQGGRAIPFSMTRTGDAKIVEAPKNAPIAKEFEGVWNGTIDAGARQMRVILTMTNQPDGTATGSIASPDGSGMEIAIGMKQKDKDLAIDVPSINASWTGTMNADGSELTGTWTQAGMSVPLVFKRAAK